MKIRITWHLQNWDNNTARQYGELKERMAINYKHDREKYTDSKTDFIKRTVKPAGQPDTMT